MKRLEALLQQGVSEQVFPLARAVVWHRGQKVFEGGNADADTVFDCASVTKVMSTTAIALELLRTHALALETPLRELQVRPEAVDGGDRAVADLLFHRAGFEPFRPYFADQMLRHPTLRDADAPAALRAVVRAETVKAVASTAPVRPARAAAVYSDLGFMLLGELLAQVGGAPLDALFGRFVAEPLGLSAGYRRLSAQLPLPQNVAPTGSERPREPAPGQEGLWSVPPAPTRLGEVDDDNAWCLDGVSGHAGLFSTCDDVARFGQAVLDGRFQPPTPWGIDAATPDSTRALGFDTPSMQAASCGPRFGRAGPRGAIGHLGFTGTSLWVDLDRLLVVALTTNRVALGRANVAIRDFRPRFHDAVLDELSS